MLFYFVWISFIIGQVLIFSLKHAILGNCVQAYMQRYYWGENIAKSKAEKCSARVGYEGETCPGRSFDETRGCCFITYWWHTDCT